MSCHDIGHGLNEVARKVLEEYDAGLIPYESAFRILKQCAKSVHWCDGNEYEATACMYDRCGRCLQKGLPMLELRPSFDWERWKAVDDEAIACHLCQDCVNELGVQEFVGDPWDVEGQARFDRHGGLRT